jgi:pyruvate formate lyase activating enzyme
MYTKKKCLRCGACVDHCPQNALSLTTAGIDTDNNACTLCGTCAGVCPAKAMEVSGTEYTVDYLVNEIEKETIFMDQSEGGVTFCGGEPLMHPDTLLELLQRCGAIGIHRAVDTTLFAKPEVVARVMNETDLFLADLKHMDSEKHRLCCGVPNEQILSNLQMITSAGKETIIRIPLIEGVNADEANIIRSAEFLSSLSWDKKVVHLLPYHAIAAGKHEKLGTVYNPVSLPMATPSLEVQERCVSIFRAHNIQAVVGG